MKAQNVLADAYKTSNFVLRTYLSDLSDEELLERPGVGCNHLNWQLGHLISSEVSLLNAVCPGAAATLPEGFAEKYTQATAGNDSPQAFCNKAELLRLMDANQAATLKAIENVTEEQLDASGPDSLKPMFATVGAVLGLVSNHALMHAGQFVPVRRRLQKPVVI